MTPDEEWMRRALALARDAAAQGEVPVGAVLVSDGAVLGEAGNLPLAARDASAHAEMLALRAACAAAGNYRLPGSTLYVTLEPCLMCAGALIHARVARVVYGAADPKTGVMHSHLRAFDLPFINHRPTVTGGVLAQDCGDLLRAFFAARR
jgi:tRNA(adenine34) deaminase